LLNLGFSESNTLRFFNDLETALEFVEDEILTEEFQEALVSPIEMRLNEFEFFAGVSAKLMTKLAKHFHQKIIPSGECIFRKGDVGDEIYFIRRGDVKIVIPFAAEQSLLITIFSQGDFFGDIAFLDADCRSANAVASGEVSLYYLSRKDYEKLARAISTRLRMTDIELMASRQS
jgi:CRP-like cAMP-binding protein